MLFLTLLLTLVMILIWAGTSLIASWVSLRREQQHYEELAKSLAKLSENMKSSLQTHSEFERVLERLDSTIEFMERNRKAKKPQGKVSYKGNLRHYANIKKGLASNRRIQESLQHKFIESFYLQTVYDSERKRHDFTTHCKHFLRCLYWPSADEFMPKLPAQKVEHIPNLPSEWVRTDPRTSKVRFEGNHYTPLQSEA